MEFWVWGVLFLVGNCADLEEVIWVTGSSVEMVAMGLESWGG